MIFEWDDPKNDRNIKSIESHSKKLVWCSMTHFRYRERIGQEMNRDIR
jgi:hypothetical protein